MSSSLSKRKTGSTSSAGNADNIKVAVRIRPLNDREQDAGDKNCWAHNDQTISSEARAVSHTFDQVYGIGSSTATIFDNLASDVIDDALKGINATIFAYGQTSSGKTFTMTGTQEEPGILPQAVGEIFERIAGVPDRVFRLSVSYIEIYNEVIRDLLTKDPSGNNLKIHESAEKGIFVGGLREIVVSTPEQVSTALAAGEAARAVGTTNLNERSSRSHTLFRMVIDSRPADSGAAAEAGASTVSALNLVDLAGSERATATGAEGIRLKEGSHINKSLLTLTQVIAKLADGAPHIPYRNSKLTRILQPSLGGNARTAVIANITPASGNQDQTISTLSFASSAKKIKNKPIVNQVFDSRAEAWLKEKVVMARRLKDLEDMVKKLTVEKRHLHSAKTVLEREAKSRNRPYEKKMNALEKEHKAATAKLRAELDATTKNLAAATAADSEKDQAINELAMALEEAKMGAETRSADLEAAVATVAELEATIELGRSQLDEANSQTEALLEARNALSKELEALRETFSADLEAAKAEAAAQVAAIASTSSETAAAAAVASKVSATLRSQVASLQATIEAAEASKAAVQTERDELATVLASTKSELEARLKATKEEADLAEAARAKAASWSDELAQRLAATEEEIAGLKAARDGALSQAENLAAQVAELTEAVQTGGQLLAEVTVKNEALETAVLSSKEEAQLLGEIQGKQETDLVKLKEQCVNLQTALYERDSQLESQRKSADETVAGAHAERDSMAAALKSKVAALELAETKLAAAAGRLASGSPPEGRQSSAELAADLEALAAENESLKKKIGSSRTVIQNKNAENLNLLAAVNKLKRDLHIAKKKLAKATGGGAPASAPDQENIPANARPQGAEFRPSTKLVSSSPPKPSVSISCFSPIKDLGRPRV